MAASPCLPCISWQVMTVDHQVLQFLKWELVHHELGKGPGHFLRPGVAMLMVEELGWSIDDLAQVALACNMKAKHIRQRARTVRSREARPDDGCAMPDPNMSTSMACACTWWYICPCPYVPCPSPIYTVSKGHPPSSLSLKHGRLEFCPDCEDEIESVGIKHKSWAILSFWILVEVSCRVLTADLVTCPHTATRPRR
jgi:hypothetical protein